MSRHSLARTITLFAFYAMAVVLFGWTASLTYSFVANALPNLPFYVPLLSLVVFDVGMLAWLMVFMYFSEGAAQRATAIIACAIDLIGMGLMVIAEILLGGQTWATAPEALGEYAIWGIGAWTVFNVVATVVFHLSSPEARRQMKIQEQKDAIMEAAYEQLESRRVADGGRVAEAISTNIYGQLTADMLAQRDTPRPVPTMPLTSGASKDEGPKHTISLEVPDGDRPHPAGNSNGSL